ncbi:inhibin alpha chain [Callorhinchus milii]|uniref:inhibin alpha chain n=1 Tax=Callorhinchus milii TaxID=7868 RepID=UPI001C3FB0A0|nr:inhibin alpha chain [Callorhinchus milii]
MLMLAVLGVWVLPGLVTGCSQHSLSEDAILAQAQEEMLERLGLDAPPNTPQTPPLGTLHHSNPFTNPRLARRLTRWLAHQTSKDADKSEVILFPISEIPCDVRVGGFGGDHTFLFQPSAHSQRRLVTAAQLWFYSGAAGAGAGAGLFVLTEKDRFVSAAESSRTHGRWLVFTIAAHRLPFLSHKLLMLQVRCPRCPCGPPHGHLPFILSNTRAVGPARSRRASAPWSPASVRLLQRPPSPEMVHDDCHRSAVNISFAALGWGNWIVQPSVFTFYYCNGTCANSNHLAASPALRECCSAVPGTMRPLRVRTTSDGGFTFKYETIPNIITDECACI